MPPESSLARILESLRRREDQSTLDALEKLIASEGSEDKVLTPAELADVLRRRYEAFQSDHTFKPGDLVRWKPGLKNKKRPKENEPAIVVAVLDVPLMSPDTQDGPGSTYFREPLDLNVGLIVDGDFVTYYFDKRRFEPFVA